jgi:hypothetical protein
VPNVNVFPRFTSHTTPDDELLEELDELLDEVLLELELLLEDELLELLDEEELLDEDELVLPDDELELVPGVIAPLVQPCKAKMLAAIKTKAMFLISTNLSNYVQLFSES